MSYDIYGAIERRDARTGRWRFVAPLDPDPNYHLFGVLAGVGLDHAPIVPLRGLPRDRDPASRAVDDPEDGAALGFGSHSWSWLTLAELRAYAWDTPLANHGAIPLRQVDLEQWRRQYDDHPVLRDLELAVPWETYQQWRSTPPHQPARWSGGDSVMRILDLRGGNPEHQAIADRLMANPDQMLTQRVLTRHGGWVEGTEPCTAWAHVTWTIPAREACRKFCAWIGQQDDPPEDLRIVFGFDA